MSSQKDCQKLAIIFNGLVCHQPEQYPQKAPKVQNEPGVTENLINEIGTLEMSSITTLSIAALILIGCGDVCDQEGVTCEEKVEDPLASDADGVVWQHAQGVAFGKPWKYGSGAAKPAIVDGEDVLKITLYAGHYGDLCTNVRVVDDIQVDTFAYRRTGEATVGMGKAWFRDKAGDVEERSILSTGVIYIDGYGSGNIEGRLSIHADADNEVSGMFSVDDCRGR